MSFDLGEFLDVMQEAGVTPDEDKSMKFLPSVELTQGIGGRHSDKMGRPLAGGQIYVGPADTSQGYYTDEISFLLIAAGSSLRWYTDNGTEKYTTTWGRRMRAFTSEGTRNLEGGNTCASANGIAPSTSFFGKEVYDHRTKLTHRIGFTTAEVPLNVLDKDGNVLSSSSYEESVPVTDTVTVRGAKVADVCNSCPLGKWTPDGKRALCESTPRFIIWVLPKDGRPGLLATIRSENVGVTTALMGAAAGNSSARHDGAALVGIQHFFNSDRNRRVMVMVPLADLHPIHVPLIRNFVCEDGTKVPFNRELSFEEQRDALKVVSLEIAIPVHPFAPEGRPEIAGRPTPVHAVQMGTTTNNFKLGNQPKRTNVPEFTMLNDKGTPVRTVTEGEYLEYLQAMQKYHQEHTHAIMLKLDALWELSREGVLLLAQKNNTTDDTPLVAGQLPSATGVNFS